jgi:hypothetical protein
MNLDYGGMEILELRVKCGGRVIYKDRCNISRKKEVSLVFLNLMNKFNLELEDIIKRPKKEQEWFNME